MTAGPGPLAVLGVQPAQKRPCHAGLHGAGCAPPLGAGQCAVAPMPTQGTSRHSTWVARPLSTHPVSSCQSTAHVGEAPKSLTRKHAAVTVSCHNPAQTGNARCHLHRLPCLSSRQPVVPTQGPSRSETPTGVTHGGEARLTFAAGSGFLRCNTNMETYPNTNPSGALLVIPPVPWSGDNGEGVSVTSLLEPLPSEAGKQDKSAKDQKTRLRFGKPHGLRTVQSRHHVNASVRGCSNRPHVERWLPRP